MSDALKVSVISPEKVLFEGAARAVTAPAFDGEMGILPMHAPLNQAKIVDGTVTISLDIVDPPQHPAHRSAPRPAVAQNHRTQRRRQGQRDDQRDRGRACNRECELPKELTGNPGDERSRNKHRAQHERDRHQRAADFAASI